MRQMRSHCPKIFKGNVGMAQGNATTNTFDNDGMQRAIREGILASASSLGSTLRPLEEGRAKKDKWSEVQKESILKACGLDIDTDWDSDQRPEIWDM
jgi:hypothetical protein